MVIPHLDDPKERGGRMMVPFHLALTVRNLEETRRFYTRVLRATEGRSAPTWVDFSLYGHQLSLHQSPEGGATFHNGVDGDAVPIPHFGVVLPWDEWHSLRDHIATKQVPFVLGPRIRFENQPGEQATFFIRDPSGNALEFKSFKDPERLFAST